MSLNYREKSKPSLCPSCGSDKVARILYGYPNFDDLMEKKLDNGELILGGCELLDDTPARQCIECKTEIFRETRE